MKTIEQLKAELAAGTITLEQFKEQAKVILAADLAAKTIDQAAHDAKLAEIEATTAAEKPLTLEEIQKMIQSETDKVRTTYAKQLKDKQDELDKLAREKMTEEERAAADLLKAQTDIKDREAALLRREVELHAVDVIGKKGLPSNFREFLLGANVEETDKRIDAFALAWDASVKEAVEKRFKDSGTDPNKGGGGGNTVNPWKPETLNLTKQWEITKENPTLAKSLAAAAGVTLVI
jgi:hypothetical protein